MAASTCKQLSESSNCNKHKAGAAMQSQGSWNNGFSMSVFRHSDFVDGFESLEGTTSLKPELIRSVMIESHRSDLIFTGEKFIVSRVLAEGYSIEFSEAGRVSKISDDYMNNVINRLWNPELEKALSHSLRQGLYVVQYVEVEQGAVDKIQNKRLYKPFVMDPEDYIIRFRKNDNGERVYVAYYSKTQLQNEPIPQSRVMIVFEPEPDGTISSPIQRCLEPLVMLRSYWENNAVIDYKMAFPLRQFYIDNRQQVIIPNTAPKSAMAPYTDALGDSDIQYGQYESIYTMDTATHAVNTIFRKQMATDEDNQNYGGGLKYDPLDRRFMYVAKENPTLPYSVLPSGVRAENGGPKPAPNPAMPTIVEMLIQRVAASLGVPAEYIYSAGKRYASDFQGQQQIVNQTTRFWQKHLERHIVVMFLDLHYREIANRVDTVFNEMNKKLKLHKARQKNTDATQELSETDELVLTSHAREMFESNVTVSVHFTSNPILQYNDVKTLYEEKIINRDSYKSLALNLFGLPASMATDEREEEQLMLQEAKRQKMVNDALKGSESAGVKGKPEQTEAKPVGTKEKAEESTNKPEKKAKKARASKPVEQ